MGDESYWDSIEVPDGYHMCPYCGELVEDSDFCCEEHEEGRGTE